MEIDKQPYDKTLPQELQFYYTQNDISMDSFMFLVNDKFVRPRIFEKRLRTLCDNTNIKYRSVHKIRKTVCSTLIDSL